MDNNTKLESSTTVHSVCLPSPSPCRVLKWIAECGGRVRKGTVLLAYTTDVSSPEPVEEVPLKATLVGVVRERLVEEGDIAQPGMPVAILEESCDHSIVVYDMCTDCGCNLRSQSSGRGSVDEGELANVTVVHGIPGIRISQKEAEALGHKDKLRLLKSRKLALIVDLDQTLIHTSVDPNIEPGLKDVYGFRLPGHPMLYHCRLRPFARQFLEKISSLYEMHVFTMGTNSYAASIAKILDPGKKLFCDRIISRDECFDPFSKVLRLKSVFPCGDEMVAIIDDREDVWSRCPNLIHVKPYVFFAGTADINAPPTRPSEAPPTSSAMHPSKPDSVPFKIRHMTSSRNNNMKPQVSLATQHRQFPSVPESQPPPNASENNITSENPVCEYSLSRMNVSTTQSTELITEGREKEPHVTPHADTIGSDTRVKVTEDSEIDRHASACSGASDSTGSDITAQMNGNKNNNNNGDDPKSSDKAKEEDSSSSSSSSSSSEGEDEEREGEGEKEAEGDSSSSSSGIDDNLFDSLEEKVGEPSPPEFDGARGGVKALGDGGVNKVGVAGKEVKLTIKELEGEVVNGSKETTEKGGERDKTEGLSQMEVDASQKSQPPLVPPFGVTTNQANKIRRNSVEVKDPDNFLIYLGDTLERLHHRFYKEFDEMSKDTNIEEIMNIPTPDLKKLIPEMRHSVLKGTRILFTGVIPTNMPPHKNREWNTARAFGAIIHDRLVPGLHSDDPNKAFRATTHVIAGRPGTSKLREAKRFPGIKVVNPKWLWACAEQWKLADEKLFPLEFDKEKIDEKHQSSHTGMKSNSRLLKPLCKANSDEVTTPPASTTAIPTQQESVSESDPVPKTPIETTTLSSAEMNTEHDSGSDSENDEAFESGNGVKQDLAMLRRLREFKRHMSLESRLSVSDEELEKMDAEVEAEISSSSSNSDHGEDLGTFIEERDDDTLLSYESYAGSEASSCDRTDAPMERLSRKRKHADIENNSSSSNSPGLEQLNESIEPSDEEEAGNDGNDSDDSVDELGALLG